MAIWMVSDWHFNHDRDFVWDKRGFNSVEEMNAEIIKRHNSVVRPDDDVYVLGDLCLGGANANEANKKLIEQLNGNIYIIMGNHCTDPRAEMYRTCKNVVQVLGFAHRLRYKKYTFYLSHYPTLTSNFDDDRPFQQRVINICGHTHTDNKWIDAEKGIIYHVEMEAHNCYPVLLDNILQEVKDYYKGVIENENL